MAISKKPASKQYSVAQARDRLTGLIHEVEAGTQVELTRRGRPVAVLVSLPDYNRLTSGQPDFWTAWERFRNEVDLKHADVEPEIFEGLRDPSPGREPAW
jgi:antitoxin Phd